MGSKKRQPEMGRWCNATTKVHADAMKIVEFLLDRDGTVDYTQEEIARKLDMIKHLSAGIHQVDTARFNRAINHLKDAVDLDQRPCCSYRVHYRRSGPASTLSLIDPSGDLGEHAKAAIGTIRGWSSREKQHQTENRRMIAVAETLADHALSRQDKDGYKLLQHVVIRLDEDGTVPPALMAEMDLWLAALT